MYARGVVDVKPQSVGTFDAAGLAPGSTAAAGDPSGTTGGGSGDETPLGGWLQFPPGTREVTLRVAVSFVDAEGAKKNLDAEAPDFDFGKMRTAAETNWKHVMDQVEVHGISERETTMLATALYHAAQMPTLTSDVDGRFVNAMGEIATGQRDRFNDFLCGTRTGRSTPGGSWWKMNATRTSSRLWWTWRKKVAQSRFGDRAR